MDRRGPENRLRPRLVMTSNRIGWRSTAEQPDASRFLYCRLNGPDAIRGRSLCELRQRFERVFAYLGQPFGLSPADRVATVDLPLRSVSLNHPGLAETLAAPSSGLVPSVESPARRHQAISDGHGRRRCVPSRFRPDSPRATPPR